MYLERYEEIKKGFEEGLKWHLTASCPNCCLDSTASYKMTITSSFLIQQGYIRKDILLDVDGESYFKVYADTDCSDGKLVYDIHLKCLNSISNNPIDRINEYLDKLERVHSKVDTKYKMDLLKEFYHDKYIIKFLPESYIEYRKGYFRELGLDEKEDLTDEDKSLVLGAIRNEQKISLDKWIDYLCDDNNNYPMWFRSYIFKGVVKVGNYYPLIGEFTKRSSSTTDPFLEVEEDVISKMYSVVSKYVNQDTLSNDEERLIKRGLDFKSLYSNLYSKKSLRSDRDDFSSIGLK